LFVSCAGKDARSDLWGQILLLLPILPIDSQLTRRRMH
jgi:hypothetical protein